MTYLNEFGGVVLASASLSTALPLFVKLCVGNGLLLLAPPGYEQDLRSFAGKFSSGRIPPGARGGDSLDKSNVSLHPRRLVPVRVSDSATAWGSQGDDSATLPTSLPDLPPL